METDGRETKTNCGREAILPDDVVLMAIKTEPELIVEQDEKTAVKKCSRMEKATKMEKPIKRSPNWEQEEKDLLSKLVMQKMEIIEDARIDTNTNKKKKEAWNALHLIFNSVSAQSRTLEQIQNQWRKTKSLAKTRNSAYISGPPTKPLESVEEELGSQLSNHFTLETNDYDSNSPNINRSLLNESKTDHDFFNNEDDTSMKRQVLISKRKKNMKCQCGIENESSKRMKLLDLSIKQKELEIRYLEENHNMEKRRHEIIEIREKEEHILRASKIKLEIENLKKNGFFT